MPNQGRAFSETKVNRIVALLSSTELSVGEIAERMGCSRSAVVSVNRHYGIRDYQGARSTWICLEPRIGESRTSRTLQ